MLAYMRYYIAYWIIPQLYHPKWILCEDEIKIFELSTNNIQIMILVVCIHLLLTLEGGEFVSYSIICIILYMYDRFLVHAVAWINLLILYGRLNWNLQLQHSMERYSGQFYANRKLLIINNSNRLYQKFAIS